MPGATLRSMGRVPGHRKVRELVPQGLTAPCPRSPEPADRDQGTAGPATAAEKPWASCPFSCLASGSPERVHVVGPCRLRGAASGSIRPWLWPWEQRVSEQTCPSPPWASKWQPLVASELWFGRCSGVVKGAGSRSRGERSHSSQRLLSAMPVPTAHCGADATHLLASPPGSVRLLSLPPSCLRVECLPRAGLCQEARRARVLWERPASPVF